MPTENRSSNTEMVSVPREWLNSVALLQMPLDELQEQAIQHLCDPCDEPAPQPHPEPIAWMVGTAIWWTKEEAERDAAATGLPIVGLGPMTDTAEVERLRKDLAKYIARANDFASKMQGAQGEAGTLRAKLEKAQEQLRTQEDLLSQAYQHDIGTPLKREIRAASLSANAEPESKS